MVYQTASDMFLDNRRCLEAEIKHLKAEDKRKILNIYDWVVCRYLESKKNHEMFREVVDMKYGEGASDEIEKKYIHRYLELAGVTNQYLQDVANGKRVGYSAECVGVEK